MQSYLKYFELDHSPFDDPEAADVVLATRSVRASVARIQMALSEDTARICVAGRRGVGKTSLARALPKLLSKILGHHATIPDADRPWRELKTRIAIQLGIKSLSRRQLLALREQGRNLLIIDRAESLSREALEKLDELLAMRGPAGEQLLQCVLLADLSSSTRRPILWWLDTLQTLQVELAPLPAVGIRSYIEKHLKRAGWRGDALFDDEAARAVHRRCDGIPGRIGELCEALLATAGDRALDRIDAALVNEVADRGVGSGRPVRVPGLSPAAIRQAEEATQALLRARNRRWMLIATAAISTLVGTWGLTLISSDDARPKASPAPIRTSARAAAARPALPTPMRIGSPRRAKPAPPGARPVLGFLASDAAATPPPFEAERAPDSAP